MASIQEQNYNAVQTMVTALQPVGKYALETESYNNPDRWHDALLTFPNGTELLVACVNEELEVEIKPPPLVDFLFEDEFKPMLRKENRKEFRFKKLQLKLSSDVIIEEASTYPSDRIYMKQNGEHHRLDVFLYGETCIPRLKLLLERICRGR